MTIHSLARSVRTPIRTAAAILLLMPVAVAPALAAHRHAPRIGVPTSYDSLGSFEPSRTGSIRSTGDFGFPGRSMRSSTLGNADFPERDPIAQNLGTTSGGGLN